jgi:hypothetical protein
MLASTKPMRKAADIAKLIFPWIFTVRGSV